MLDTFMDFNTGGRRVLIDDLEQGGHLQGGLSSGRQGALGERTLRRRLSMAKARTRRDWSLRRTDMIELAKLLLKSSETWPITEINRSNQVHLVWERIWT
jgi:hypothetical protein